MIKKEFPIIHFYDQSFEDLYEKTWKWLEDTLCKSTSKSAKPIEYFAHQGETKINQVDSILSTFFLVYSNSKYDVGSILDVFYEKQEANGAIRGVYDMTSGKAIIDKDNPESIMMPLFSLAELNIYHKVGNKKRLQEVVPILEKYFDWVVETFRDDTGLYATPLDISQGYSNPRKGAHYLIDFNCQQAINALYMSAIGDVLNDKEMNFKYKKHYFSIKTRINEHMWSETKQFYFDLDKDLEQVQIMTLPSYWTFLAEIPNEDRILTMVDYLKDPNYFGTDHPFPSLAVKEKGFSEKGEGFYGSVFPALTFMVIKGLEKFNQNEFARECALRHLYFVLDTLHNTEDKNCGSVYEAYLPYDEGCAEDSAYPDFPRKGAYAHIGLSTITLMIENVLGLYINLTKKTVEWVMPTLELMGIENLELKRNMITILSNKSRRGWEIRLESDKLYYLTVIILDEQKKKRWPIPSGKCSILIEKM